MAFNRIGMSPEPRHLSRFLDSDLVFTICGYSELDLFRKLQFISMISRPKQVSNLDFSEHGWRTGAAPGIKLILFLKGHEGSRVGAKVGSGSSKFGVLSSKPFNEVFVVCVCISSYCISIKCRQAGRTQNIYDQQSNGSLPHSTSTQGLLYLFYIQYARIALNRNFLEDAQIFRC